MPSSTGIRERRLDGEADDEAWREAVRRTVMTRTAWMDVHEIRQALAGLRPMPVLPVALAAEAAVLRQVAAGRAKPERVVALAVRTDKPACPRCYMNLPVIARERLREHRVSLTCCDLVLLDPCWSDTCPPCRSLTSTVRSRRSPISTSSRRCSSTLVAWTPWGFGRSTST